MPPTYRMTGYDDQDWLDDEELERMDFQRKNPEFLSKRPPQISSKLESSINPQRDIASYLTRKYKRNNDQATSSSDLYDPTVFEEAIKTDPELLHSFHPTIENKEVNYIAQSSQPLAKKASTANLQSQPQTNEQNGLPLTKLKVGTETLEPNPKMQNEPDWDKLEQMLLDDMAKGQYKSATSRLIGNINMAVNQAIGGLTNTQPDYTIPKSIIEGGNQKFDQSSKMGDKIKDYLKAKAEYGKLGMEKKKMEQTYELQKERNAILGRASQSQKNQYSPLDTRMQQKYIDQAMPFIASGGLNKTRQFVETTKQLANELRTKIKEKPGLLSMLAKNTGAVGEELFNMTHQELANIASRAKSLYMANMKDYVGNNQISDNDVRQYLSTLYNWALSPNQSADLLEMRAQQLMNQARAYTHMNDHWQKYHTFENYNFTTMPSGSYTEERQK